MSTEATMKFHLDLTLTGEVKDLKSDDIEDLIWFVIGQAQSNLEWPDGVTVHNLECKRRDILLLNTVGEDVIDLTSEESKDVSESVR